MLIIGVGVSVGGSGRGGLGKVAVGGGRVGSSVGAGVAEGLGAAV
jgi:hypothetical protein